MATFSGSSSWPAPEQYSQISDAGKENTESPIQPA